MKKQLYRAAAATVLGLSLTTGIVAADTGNIDTTGPNSSNRVTSRVTNRTRVENNNKVNVHNDNDQSARTGDAKVWGNTRGGDAETGDASNSNRTSADVEIDNSASTNNIDPSSGNGNWGGGGLGSINDTGPNSSNRVSSTVSNRTTVENNNRITVDNDNEQHASSGDASVSGNTRGGSAETGDATNTNSSNFTISVTN